MFISPKNILLKYPWFYINKNNLLLFSLQCDVPEGGLVPKSLYKEEYSDKSPEGPPLSIDSLYQTSYVVKDFPHEVSLFGSSPS